MKRLAVIAALVSAVLLPASVLAAPQHTGKARKTAHVVNTGVDLSQLNPKKCDPIGVPLVNVTYRLTNDYDSAVGGTAWANDTFFRNLRIWATYGGLCAIVVDQGTFVTFAGPSPNGTGTVSAGRQGTIVGGYRTGVFPGYVLASPDYRIFGYLGTFDLQCTGANACPGAHPTISSFVANYDSSLPWWGWQYNTKKHPHQQWINSSDGNSGDITG